MSAHPMADALARALADDERVHLLGEAVDLAPATRGLRAEHPDRVHLLPAADATLVGVAVGMALDGARPVVELAGPAALWGALQQLGQEAAPAGVPVVLRVPVTPGATLPAWVLGALEGVTVVAPSCASEARYLLEGALAADGPVVLLEPQAALTRPGEGLEPLPLGQARAQREGEHVTVLAWGDGVQAAQDAADALAAEGVDVGVVDLRCLNPLDIGAVADSVHQTGRAVIAGGPATVLAAVTEHAFLRLESPPVGVDAEAGAIADAARAAMSW